MKLSNSKRQLAEIIRASGNEWVERYVVATQDGDGRIYVYQPEGVCTWNRNLKLWSAISRYLRMHLATSEPIAQCHRTTLTRDEYMAYLAEFETPAQPADIVSAVSSPIVHVPVLIRASSTVQPLEKLITNWQEAKCTADHARSELARLEQAERDAHAAVESALSAAGWGSVPESEPVEVSQDPSTWQVGDTFEVISNTSEHGVSIGDNVVMHCEDGTDMREYRNLSDDDIWWIVDEDLRKL